MRSVLLPLVCAVSAVIGSATEPAKSDKPVQLAPFAVKGDPVNSFAFDLVVKLDKQTKRIAQLLISGVREGSDAEREGLRAGDEIVRINGRPITDFPADFSPGGDLNKILLNRPPGERLDLEIITRRTTSVTVRAAGPALAW